MKALTLLIILCYSYTVHCTCYTSQFCSDEITQLKSCVFLGGVLNNNDTCVDLGFQVGACCVRGVCYLGSNNLFCAFAGGVWKKGGSCPCEEVGSSCCIERSCISGTTKDGCENDYHGVFYDGIECNIEHCRVQPKYMGACCMVGDGTHEIQGTCYDMPEEFCDKESTKAGIWYPNTTCEVVDCFPRTPIPILNMSDSEKPGRCCDSSCRETNPADCVAGFEYFEWGIGCNTYPCSDQGLCIRKGSCIDDMPRDLCKVTGASYIEGGICLGEFGACRYKDNCNDDYTEEECGFLNGDFAGNGTKCDEVNGACCDGKTCSIGLGTECNIEFYKFYPGETSCSNFICNASCCVNDFCTPDVPERVCLSSEENGVEVVARDIGCDTDICTDYVNYTSSYRKIPIPIDVGNIGFISTNSSVEFKISSVFTESNITITESNISFVTLKLKKSQIELDFTSTFTVEQELSLTDCTILVNLSEDEKESIISQDHLLITSKNLTTTTLTLLLDEDVSYYISNNSIYLTYTAPTEISSISSSNITSNDTTGILIIILIIIALSLTGLTITLICFGQDIRQLLCDTTI